MEAQESAIALEQSGDVQNALMVYDDAIAHYAAAADYATATDAIVKLLNAHRALMHHKTELLARLCRAADADEAAAASDNIDTALASAVAGARAGRDSQLPTAAPSAAAQGARPTRSISATSTTTTPTSTQPAHSGHLPAQAAPFTQSNPFVITGAEEGDDTSVTARGDAPVALLSAGRGHGSVRSAPADMAAAGSARADDNAANKVDSNASAGSRSAQEEARGESAARGAPLQMRPPEALLLEPLLPNVRVGPRVTTAK